MGLDACAGCTVASEPSLSPCNGNTTGCSLSPKVPSRHPPTAHAAHGAGGCEPCPALPPTCSPALLAVQTPERGAAGDISITLIPFLWHPAAAGRAQAGLPMDQPRLERQSCAHAGANSKRVGARQGSAAHRDGMRTTPGTSTSRGTAATPLLISFPR